jgi:hypothetical protein
LGNLTVRPRASYCVVVLVLVPGSLWLARGRYRSTSSPVEL